VEWATTSTNRLPKENSVDETLSPSQLALLLPSINEHLAPLLFFVAFKRFTLFGVEAVLGVCFHQLASSGFMERT
jgi:hypothetical protein